jgi:hypothetical protein
MARAICAAQGLDWKDQFGIYSSNGDPLAHEAYMHDADAALSALCQWLDAEGLVVVPRETTEEMLDAVMSTNTANNVWQAVRIYTAMISAAPDALETKP